MDQGLLNYIQSARAAGTSEEQIRHVLAMNKLSDNEIDTLLTHEVVLPPEAPESEGHHPQPQTENVASNLYIMLAAVLVLAVGGSFAVAFVAPKERGVEQPTYKFERPRAVVPFEHTTGRSNKPATTTVRDNVVPITDDNNTGNAAAPGVPSTHPTQQDTLHNYTTPLQTPTSAPCVDTDGGKYPYLYGEVTGPGRKIVTESDGTRLWVDSEVRTSADICVSAGGTTQYENQTVYRQLNELFCGDDGRVTVHGTDCPHGCRDGACLQPAPKPSVWIRADGQEESVRKEFDSTVTITWGSDDVVSCNVYSFGAATDLWTEDNILTTGSRVLGVKDTITSTHITIECISSTGRSVTDRVKVYAQAEV